MITLTLAEVAAITGGELVGGADPATEVTGTVEFDSRKVTRGGLFVALPGERVDGHDFAAKTLADGAVAALVSRDVGVPGIRVDDQLAAMALLARAVVDRLPDATIVGLTGSSGKTSTKDLLAQLLSRRGRTVAPPESFNNELGHPYTVLRADRDTEFLVLEKSARKVGHITELTKIAPPRIGVALNVGTAHVGEFGSVAAIATAKSELVRALPTAADGGVAILNADDVRVAAMAAVTQARVVRYGRGEDADVRAESVTMDEAGRPGFVLSVPATGESAQVTMGLYGEHHVANALATAAVGLEVGMSVAEIAAALSEAVLVSKRRMEVTTRKDGVTVVDDTFNANPDSVRAALTTVARMASDRRWWVVLGEMAELGGSADAEHESVGRLAAELGAARVIAVGDGASRVVVGAAGTRAEAVSDTDAAAVLLAAEVEAGDVVLVKGSKVAHMERVAAQLLRAELQRSDR